MDEIRFRIKAAAALQVEGNFAQGAQIPAGETDVDGLADGMQIVVGDAAALGAQISVGVIRAVAGDDVKRFGGCPSDCGSRRAGRSGCHVVARRQRPVAHADRQRHRQTFTRRDLSRLGAAGGRKKLTIVPQQLPRIRNSGKVIEKPCGRG